jgi:hypothetical protein
MNKIDWCAPIDSYCERVGPGFWAEPVNAASNAAFLLAAVSAWFLWRRAGGSDRAALALIGVVGTVGVGSFLFHTFAQKWSLSPTSCRSWLSSTATSPCAAALPRARPRPGALALAGFVAFNVGFVRLWTSLFEPAAPTSPTARPATSRRRWPCWPSAGWLVVRAWRAGSGGSAAEEAGRGLLAAAAVFAVSLLFRSIDHAVCSGWPLGTHFAWHGLNAVVLFLLIRAAIRFRVRASALA